MILVLLISVLISNQVKAAPTCKEILFNVNQSAFFQNSQNLFTSQIRQIVSKEIYNMAEGALLETGWIPIEGHGPKELWEYDGPQSVGRFYNPKKDYEEAFGSILIKSGVGTLNDFFENFLKERRIKNQHTHVLDLFGSGFFIEGQSLADSITGMRYGPYDQSQLGNDYKGIVPTEILGDAMNSKTWQKLDESFLKRSIHSVDLVTMRPKGGWQQATFSDTADQNIQALKFIIGQVLSRLSPTGRFYFKIPIPQLPGKISEHPDLQALVFQIQNLTPYKLILESKVRSDNFTYCLDGALVPK